MGGLSLKCLLDTQRRTPVGGENATLASLESVAPGWTGWVRRGQGGPGSGDGTCGWGAIGAERKLTRAVSRAAKEEGGLTVSRVADGSRKTRQNH